MTQLSNVPMQPKPDAVERHMTLIEKFRLVKSTEGKRKDVIKKLLESKVAVLCKCWDCDERLATIQAVTGFQVGSYPYITDNDKYGYGYAIDNRGNEITGV